MSDQIIRLSRPPDGRIMCCICFEYRQPYELFVDAEGSKWDVCAAGPCAWQAGLSPKDPH